MAIGLRVSKDHRRECVRTLEARSNALELLAIKLQAIAPAARLGNEALEIAADIRKIARALW